MKMLWETGNAASETSHRGHCSARLGDGTELGVDGDVYVQKREDSLRRVGANSTVSSQIEAAAQHTWKTLCALLDTFDQNVGQWLEETREERDIYQTPRSENRLPGVNFMRAEQVDQQARNASGSLLAMITHPDRFLLVWFRACDVLPCQLTSRLQEVKVEEDALLSIVHLFNLWRKKSVTAFSRYCERDFVSLPAYELHEGDEIACGHGGDLTYGAVPIERIPRVRGAGSLIPYTLPVGAIVYSSLSVKGEFHHDPTTNA
jgi:hypothetical protein